MHSKITKIYGQMCLLGLAFDIFITLRKKEWKNTEDCNDYMANNLVVFSYSYFLRYCFFSVLYGSEDAQYFKLFLYKLIF